MNIETYKIREYRLLIHHLDHKIPRESILDAAGVCGLQNSPPGAWETALFNRIEGCTLQMLHSALYEQKDLLQAWSYRGVPVVFPTEQSAVFLSALCAREDEQPWIYTRGITAALDFVKLPFDELLVLMKKAIVYLDCHTIQSKEALDQTLADLIQADLPDEKRSLWNSPSMYGNPERQTVGGAIVSFLLRPCAFSMLVVFGRRQGISPTFTSFANWVGSSPGESPGESPEAEKEIVRKFLHCYGPATVDSFMNWLGCSPRQARRLWRSISEEMETVQVEGGSCCMLSVDVEGLLHSESGKGRLLLLGAHDPYLDMRDRTVILENKALHKAVWKTVANPGVILKGGRIIGIWKTKTVKDKLDLSLSLWEAILPAEKKELERYAEEYGAFRSLRLGSCTLDHV